MSRDWKSLEEQVRKDLYCYKQSTVGNSDEGANKETWKELDILRDCLSCCDWNNDRNEEVKNM